jgi:hypothetical protein
MYTGFNVALHILDGETPNAPTTVCARPNPNPFLPGCTHNC